MIIDYYAKDVYGQTLNYILDADIARLIGRLIGAKTVNEENMQIMAEVFGCTWNQVLPPKAV